MEHRSPTSAQLLALWFGRSPCSSSPERQGHTRSREINTALCRRANEEARTQDQLTSRLKRSQLAVFHEKEALAARSPRAKADASTPGSSLSTLAIGAGLNPLLASAAPWSCSVVGRRRTFSTVRSPPLGLSWRSSSSIHSRLLPALRQGSRRCVPDSLHGIGVLHTSSHSSVDRHRPRPPSCSGSAMPHPLGSVRRPKQAPKREQRGEPLNSINDLDKRGRRPAKKVGGLEPRSTRLQKHVFGCPSTEEPLYSGADFRRRRGGDSRVGQRPLLRRTDVRLQPEPGALAILLTAVYVGVNFAANYLQLRHQRIELQLRGKIAGLVLNLIGGVAKLRICRRRAPRVQGLGANSSRSSAGSASPSARSRAPRRWSRRSSRSCRDRHLLR